MGVIGGTAELGVSVWSGNRLILVPCSHDRMIGFTTHLSPARHLVNVTPTAAHPGSGGTLVTPSVKANSGDPPIRNEPPYSKYTMAS